MGEALPEESTVLDAAWSGRQVSNQTGLLVPGVVFLFDALPVVVCHHGVGHPRGFEDHAPGVVVGHLPLLCS